MTTPRQRSGSLLLVSLLVTGLNLRGAIAAVAPVLPEIRAELGLSATTAGLLTTLPVLCFAALAPASAWLGRRLGPVPAVLAGLVAIAVGTGLRVLDGAPVLLAGTFVIGAGMTVGNVLTPAITKAGFGERAGSLTGVYTAALAAGAALTAALTAPIAAVLGWRGALAGWAVLALAGAALWAVLLGRRPSPAVASPAVDRPGPPGVPVSPWRHPVAWAVAALLAMQSVLFYAVTTWLPSLLIDELDGDLGAASAAASLFQILGIPATLIVPALVGRWPGQGGLAVAVAAGWATLPAGLLAAPEAWPVWATVGGLAQGAGLSLAFTLVVLRAADPDGVRRLSGMAQLVSYSVGAAAPVVVGALYSVTGGWAAPLILLIAAGVAFGLAGVVAGRPVTVGGKQPSV